MQQRSGTDYVYGYNNRKRLATVTVAGSLRGTYTYNGLEQLAARVTTNMPVLAEAGNAGGHQPLHPRSQRRHAGGVRAINVIAETAGGGATGSTGTHFFARLRHDARVHLATAPIVARPITRGVNRQRKS